MAEECFYFHIYIFFLNLGNHSRATNFLRAIPLSSTPEDAYISLPRGYMSIGQVIRIPVIISISIALK